MSKASKARFPAVSRDVYKRQVYNNTPAAVLALKKSGIVKPIDLNGKKLGAPVFDAGRKAFSLFQKANGVGNVVWTCLLYTSRCV